MLLIIAYLSIKAGLLVPAFSPFKWQTRVLSLKDFSSFVNPSYCIKSLVSIDLLIVFKSKEKFKGFWILLFLNT